MKTIKKLNEQRTKLGAYVASLGMRNAYGRTAEESLKAEAEYKLAMDAWTKAEREYGDAISGLSADELAGLIPRAKSEKLIPDAKIWDSDKRE